MRKATDILLEIELSQKEILAYLKNQDMLLKNLINRISNLEKAPEKEIIEKEVKPGIKPSIMPGIKPGVKLAVPSNEEYNFIDDDAPKGKHRDLKYISSEKITVSQKITFSDGKPAPSAKVEIFTKSPGTNSLVLIDNKKTNMNGRWIGSLPPGNYLIKAFKKGTDAPKIGEVSVVVQDSSEPIELISLQIN